MTTPEPAAEVRQTHIHGSVYGFVQGDHNTVTIVLNGEPRTVPFLAPPPAAHPFIGRDEVVAAVRERLLAGGTTALSALNGLPGVGKTALAVVLAHDPAMLSRYADGVLWAGLGRTPDVVASLAAWGAALGVAAQDVPAPAGVEEWARAVHAAIGLRRMLLVVDDAWTAEAALAFRLGGPNCARLLTTRVPEVAARFAGDAVCRISELEEADGLLLLEALAGTAEDERDAMRELVRLAGGLPLALTLMGGYLRVRTAGGRRERLRRAIEELGTARERLRLAQPQSPIERHPSLPLHVPLSLLAVLEVSAARLRPSARRTLTALGCFPSKPSTFSTAAALAVGGGTEDDLDELSDAGLVEASGADRHTLHQTVSDYARDGQPAEAEAAGLRLIRFFVAFLEGEVGGDPDGIDQELSNIREALRLAHEQGRREDLVRGMRAAFPLLEGRGLYKMAETHLRHSIAAARDLADPAAEAFLLLGLGTVLEQRGDLDGAEPHLREALALIRAAAGQADPAAEAFLLLGLGTVLEQRGDLDGAEPHLREALALIRAAAGQADPAEEGAVLTKLAWLVGIRGDLEESASLFTEVGSAGSGYQRSRSLQGLGWVAGQRGAHEQARAHLAESLELARGLDDQNLVGDVLHVLAWSAGGGGDFATAEAHFTEALSIARRFSRRDQTISALQGLGWVAAMRGAFAQARGPLGEALALAREVDHQERVPILVALGWATRAVGDLDAAETHLKEAAEIAERSGANERLARVRLELGQLALQRHDHATAEIRIREALAAGRQLGIVDLEAGALLALGRTVREAGRTDEARDVLAEGLGSRAAENANTRALFLHAMGEVELDLGHAHAALEWFTDMTRTARDAGNDEQAAVGLYCQAQAALADRDAGEARRLGEAALRELTALGSHRGAEVTTWLESLPG